MTLTPLEVSLLAGFGATAAGMIGAAINRKWAANRCDECGIGELKVEIRRNSLLLRLVAEKQGITVAQQIELERASHE